MLILRTKIVKIGNSRGIRILKPYLEQSRLGPEVQLKVKRGEIRIIPVKPSLTPQVIASESTLAKDWERPEEDAAWAGL